MLAQLQPQAPLLFSLLLLVVLPGLELPQARPQPQPMPPDFLDLQQLRPLQVLLHRLGLSLHLPQALPHYLLHLQQ